MRHRLRWSGAAGPDPALFARWYGPGAETSIIQSDVRAGGQSRLSLSWGGKLQYQRLDWREVEPTHRLAFVLVSADAEWAPTPPPQMADWPKQLMTVVELEQTAAGTLQRLTWTPHESTAIENAAFAAAIPMLDRGWGAGFALLDGLLAGMPVA